VADFHQPPTIPTLHRLNARRTRGLEADLDAWRHDRVVALGPADFSQYRRARSFFDHFDVPVSFLRIAHPELEGILRAVERAGLGIGHPGKGQTCWLASGVLLAHGETGIVVMHDCDIRRYSRSLLAYLCVPLASPELNFEFAKGYYARVRGRLFGQLTRLFVTPLVRALQRAGVDTPLLRLIGVSATRYRERWR
jgi:glucosyl-3-phosphoglycerate synthase